MSDPKHVLVDYLHFDTDCSSNVETLCVCFALRCLAGESVELQGAEGDLGEG